MNVDQATASRAQRSAVRQRRLRAFAMVGALFASGAASAGFRVNVTTSNDEFGSGPGCSLREALYTIHHAANFGGCAHSAFFSDQILVPAGTYSIGLTPVAANPEAGGAFKVLNAVSIFGAGASQTIVDGGSIDTVFKLAPGAAASVYLSGVTVRGGLGAPNRGAAIDLGSGALTLQADYITANSGGPTIFSLDSDGLTLRQSTVAGNRDTGVLMDNNSAAAITLIENSTISSNVSRQSAGAMVVFAAHAGSNAVTIANATIAYNVGEADGVSNSAPGGIEIYGTGAALYLRNSILAHNNRGDRQSFDCVTDKVSTSQGYNLIGDSVYCPFQGNTASDIVGIDPQLAPLFDYGSGIPTHAVFPGSPAYNSGNPATPGSGGTACTGVDERGSDRSGVDRPCDIGAYEYHADWFVNSTDDSSDIVSDGVCNVGFGKCTLRGALDEANAAGRPVTIEIPAGNYVITKAPTPNGQDNTDGDFVITSPYAVTLVGAGVKQTVIDGGGLDRVMTLGDTDFGAVALHGLSLRNGSASGLQVFHGSALLDHVRVTANAGHTGIGVNVRFGGSADIVASTIDNNHEIGTGQSCGGGGVAVDAGGRASLLNSTVANNRSARFGGGICNNGGNVSIAFSTIAGNVESPDIRNGGIADGTNAGTWHVINSIISGNKVTNGADADCGASLQVDGHTLVRTAAGCTFGGQHANQVISGADPGLTPLIMQGGATPTIGLAPNSPVHGVIQQQVDCVDGAGIEQFADQRGVLRPGWVNWGMPQYCDLGAFQGDSDVIFANGFE